MRPQVTFNALALQTAGSGVQTYIRELLAAMSSLEPVGSTDSHPELSAHVQRSEAGSLPAGVVALPHADARGSVRVVKGTMLDQGPGLFHGLNVEVPLRRRRPLISTIHDLAVLDAPWAFPAWRVQLEKRVLVNAMKQADELIAVSDFTADRIAEHFGRRATVTRLAPRPAFAPATTAAVEAIRRKHALPDQFVLHLGTVEPRKNTAGLAKACEEVGVPLVLAGAVRVSETLAGEVTALGYVPDDDICALFGAATVVGYPSSYEGFGLPPIEAMACGAAVAATAVGALPEVLNGAVPLAPVDDHPALVDLLGDLLSDDEAHRAVAEAGRIAVSALRWSETAKRTFEVYDGLW